MKYFIILSVVACCFYSCKSKKTTTNKKSNTEVQAAKNDTIRIANSELEYEITIFEIGFDNWLETQPPMGYYGISYLENKNNTYVISYNNRVIKDQTRQLYEQEINYDPTVHYGMEVNYLLFNYFKYFQQKYKQKL